MILTTEILRNNESCVDGYKFALENNLIGLDYDTVIDYCKNNDQNDYANWMEQQKNKIATWRAAGKTMTPHQYRFYNRVTNNPETFTSLESAQTALDTEITNFIANAKSLFSVVHEQIDYRGFGIWKAVDIDTFDSEGTFQVFNQRTGQHIRVEGRAAALAKRDELVAEFSQMIKSHIIVNYIDELGQVTTDWEPVVT